MQKEIVAAATVIGAIAGIVGLFYTQSVNNAEITGNSNIVAQGESTIQVIQQRIPTKKKFVKPSNFTKLSISYPRDGAYIDRNLTMSGYTSEIPAGYKLWSYVYAPGISKYYPQRVIEVSSGGSWEKSGIVVGALGDHGAKFEIGVLLTDRLGSSKLSNKKSGGVTNLPDGIKKSIVVVRK